MQNFKDETNNVICDMEKEYSIKLEIDELRFNCMSMGTEYKQIGGKAVDWEAAQKILKLDNWVYDDGYGLQEFDAFITFKNFPVWLERTEYDGSEWWIFKSRPSLG